MAVVRRVWSRWITILAMCVCVAFALKALVLIDSTTLWGDELYSVGKSYQPSFRNLIAMLREDTHPPLYYSLLWLWGRWVGQTPVSLRLLSWLAYLIGALVMLRQTWVLSQPESALRATTLAALLAFCSPYPVRFAIEGKSYALLVLLVALALSGRRLWLQRRQGLMVYGLTVAAAALTHFYGFFFFGAAALWDAWRQRWRLAIVALVALLPTVGWIAYARHYLASSRAGSWIGRPDFALLEDTLARALGPWPLPKLVVLLLVILAVRRWGLRNGPINDSVGVDRQLSGSAITLLDLSGVIPAGLMVLAVVMISFLKPMAFSRYFVVCLPALVPWLCVAGASMVLLPWSQRLVGLMLALLFTLWWHQSFLGLTEAKGGSREADQFRAISQITAIATERYSPRPHLLNLSDRMELAAGRVSTPPTSWGNAAALESRLLQAPRPKSIWLAASGPDDVVRQRLKPLEEQVDRAGYHCRAADPDLAFARLLRCQPASASSP
jgi:mannosyltransferase